MTEFFFYKCMKFIIGYNNKAWLTLCYCWSFKRLTHWADNLFGLWIIWPRNREINRTDRHPTEHQKLYKYKINTTFKYLAEKKESICSPVRSFDNRIETACCCCCWCAATRIYFWHDEKSKKLEVYVSKEQQQHLETAHNYGVAFWQRLFLLMLWYWFLSHEFKL